MTYLASDMESLIDMFPEIGDKYTYNVINKLLGEDEFIYCYLYDPRNHKDFRDYESENRSWMSQLYMRIKMPDNLSDVIIFKSYNTSSPLALWISHHIQDDEEEDEEENEDEEEEEENEEEDEEEENEEEDEEKQVHREN